MSDQVRFARALRRIARDMIQRIYPKRMSASRRRDLTTSIVRQWIGYEGHAAVFTPRGRYWIELTTNPPHGFNVSVTEVPGHPIKAFFADWHIDRRDVPDIVKRLNLAQSAEFTSLFGRRLRMWIDPVRRALHIEPLDDELQAPESLDDDDLDAGPGGSPL